MRTKQLVSGLNNTQRIRVILNGVGFVTTVKDAVSGPFVSQNSALISILMSLTASMNKDNATGLGRTVRVYDDKMQPVNFDVQVNLL
jgi:hypothetical protein